jgi:hypothetical protein
VRGKEKELLRWERKEGGASDSDFRIKRFVFCALMVSALSFEKDKRCVISVFSHFLECDERRGGMHKTGSTTEVGETDTVALTRCMPDAKMVDAVLFVVAIVGPGMPAFAHESVDLGIRQSMPNLVYQ